MGNSLHGVFDMANGFVEKLTVTQTAAIGGAGSGVSVASTIGAESMNLIQYFTLAMGAVGALLTVTLLILKIIQQRRDMCAQEDKIDILDRKVRAASKWKSIYD